jgi:hypothetical protein
MKRPPAFASPVRTAALIQRIAQDFQLGLADQISGSHDDAAPGNGSILYQSYIVRGLLRSNTVFRGANVEACCTPTKHKCRKK